MRQTTPLVASDTIDSCNYVTRGLKLLSPDKRTTCSQPCWVQNSHWCTRHLLPYHSRQWPQISAIALMSLGWTVFRLWSESKQEAILLAFAPKQDKTKCHPVYVASLCVALPGSLQKANSNPFTFITWVKGLERAPELLKHQSDFLQLIRGELLQPLSKVYVPQEMLCTRLQKLQCTRVQKIFFRVTEFKSYHFAIADSFKLESGKSSTQWSGPKHTGDHQCELAE